MADWNEYAYLTFTEGKSNKFYEVGRSGARLFRRWGRVGSTGQTMTQNFSDPYRASTEFLALVSGKKAKGYQLQADVAGDKVAPIKVIRVIVISGKITFHCPECDDDALSVRYAPLHGGNVSIARGLAVSHAQDDHDGKYSVIDYSPNASSKAQRKLYTAELQLTDLVPA